MARGTAQSPCSSGYFLLGSLSSSHCPSSFALLSSIQNFPWFLLFKLESSDYYNLKVVKNLMYVTNADQTSLEFSEPQRPLRDPPQIHEMGLEVNLYFV